MRTVKPRDNVLTVLFNKTCTSLLSLFYNNAERSYYLREVVRKLDIGSGTVQREITKLVSAELINKQINGKQVYYKANTKSPVYNELRGLIIKTFGLADIIKDALIPFASKIDYAFIYGSQTDGTSSADSDIDLMVVGDVNEMELHRVINKVEKKLDKAINYSLFTLKEFDKRKKEKKGFIERIITGKKIMLIGDKDEI
jgi:predicted nucleotidyltransferase